MKSEINQKLTELQKTHKDFWNINPETGSFLNMLIKSGNYKHVLEVGTSNGYSAIWLALALQETGGHLVTIEFSEERKEMARKNLEDCGLLNLATLLQGSAIDILKDIKSEYFNLRGYSEEPFVDFAFIDASKLEYVEYFNLIHPKMKKNGMIIADNVISHENKVWSYIDLVSAHDDYQTVKLNLGSGLLVSLKIK